MSETYPAGLTDATVKFIVETDWGAFSPDVIAIAKRCIQDGVAVSIGGRKSPESCPWRATFSLWEEPLKRVCWAAPAGVCQLTLRPCGMGPWVMQWTGTIPSWRRRPDGPLVF